MTDLMVVTVNRKTGKTTVEMPGITGPRCVGIHEQIDREMLVLGAKVSDSHDTPNMDEIETVSEGVHIQARS